MVNCRIEFRGNTDCLITWSTDGIDCTNWGHSLYSSLTKEGNFSGMLPTLHCGHLHSDRVLRLGNNLDVPPIKLDSSHTCIFSKEGNGWNEAEPSLP